MLLYNHLFAIIILVFLVGTQVIARKKVCSVTSTRDEWISPTNKSLVYEWNLYRNNHIRIQSPGDDAFHYTICSSKYSDWNLNTARFLCNLTLETNLRKRTCNDLNITAYSIGSSFLSLHPLGEEKVILRWFQAKEGPEILSIVNMANCSISNLSFDLEYLSDKGLVLYEKTFDFIVSDIKICSKISRQQIKEMRPMCRLTYNLQGQLITTQTLQVPSQYFAVVRVDPVSSISAEKGFFITYYGDDNYVIELIKLGERIELMSIPKDDANYLGISGVNGGWLSNENEKYGLCWLTGKGSKKMRCVQFDADGRTRLDVFLDFSESPAWRFTYNLAEDGMLLITGKCKRSDVSLLDYFCHHFSVWRIWEDGSYEIQLELGGLDLRCLDPSDYSYFFTVDVALNRAGNEFCFYFACLLSLSGEEQKMTYISKCIPKQHILSSSPRINTHP